MLIGSEREKKIFYLYSTSIERQNLSFYENYFGYFDGTISLNEAKLIARLIKCLSPNEERPIIALYPIDEDRWREISKKNWTTILEKDFERKGWFGCIKKWKWVVGYTSNLEKFAEILQFSWNISGNETLFVLYADPSSLEFLKHSFKDDFGDSSENAKEFVKHSPFVINRGHDGLWLEIFSTELDSEKLFEILFDLTEGNVLKKETPL
ncbi:MAG: hypothetical protein AABZ84_06650 [Pseudomonadota bacterium]